MVYTCLSVSTSMVYGLKCIAKDDTKGGFILEDIKSLFTGVCVSGFLGSLLFLSHKKIAISFVQFSTPEMNQAWAFLIKSNILTVALSLGFFTMFYNFSAAKPCTWKNSLKGAATFVTCFLVGKSFYWIYLLYTKDSLTQSYGNFYTMFIAGFWIYYITCSLFYGASVAYYDSESIYHKKEKGPKGPPSADQAPPPLENIDSHHNDSKAA